MFCALALSGTEFKPFSSANCLAFLFNATVKAATIASIEKAFLHFTCYWPGKVVTGLREHTSLRTLPTQQRAQRALNIHSLMPSLPRDMKASWFLNLL